MKAAAETCAGQLERARAVEFSARSMSPPEVDMTDRVPGSIGVEGHFAVVGLEVLADPTAPCCVDHMGSARWC